MPVLLSALLVAGAASALTADLLSTAKVWSLAPALVERKESWIPEAVSTMLGRLRHAFARRDVSVWEEVCYSIALHLRAGETAAQAIRGVGAEGGTFAHAALRAVSQVYEAGTSLQEALARQAEEYPELGYLAGVLDMAGRSGGDIPSLLCHASESMRRQRMARGELRSKLAEARGTAALLSALPWLIGAFTFSSDPIALRVVTSDPRGRALLWLAALTWAAGNVAVVSAIGALQPRRPGKRKGRSLSWS